MVTACVNPNGQIVVVALNQTDQPIAYDLVSAEKHAHITIPANALQTIILE